MPELPEVELIIKSIKQDVLSKTLLHVERIHDSDTEISQGIFPYRIARIKRWGKYFWFENDGSQHTLLFHLGMTGRLYYGKKVHTRYPRYRLAFEGGEELIFDDQRRFGKLKILNASPEEYLANHLGPDIMNDPLDAERLYLLAQKKKTQSIHTFLLDQHNLAGLGNIYTNELLFRSEIRPDRLIRQCTYEELNNLCRQIEKILEEVFALDSQSILGYYSKDKKDPFYKDFLQIYGKEGNPCKVCGSPILKEKGKRTSYYCPTCQK